MEGMDVAADQCSAHACLRDAQGTVDCIYVAASGHDARFTRICVASIRFFYPDVPIRLLVGGPLQRGLAQELRRYWNVGIAQLSSTGDYGWGFVHLEPLFGTPGEKFLVLDSDTVITGPILDKWRNCAAPFLVDDETQLEVNAAQIYYDWRKVVEIDSRTLEPSFLFNAGQWFGTAGVLSRADFGRWLEWTMPRRTVPAGLFKNGDQGVFNYVLNQKAALEGLKVERQTIMRWPGHSMDGLSLDAIVRRQAPALVVHWAGMKKPLLRNMVGGDVLLYFEHLYYSRVGGGTVRRSLANCRDISRQGLRSVVRRIKFGIQRYVSRH